MTSRRVYAVELSSPGYMPITLVVSPPADPNGVYVGVAFGRNYAFAKSVFQPSLLATFESLRSQLVGLEQWEGIPSAEELVRVAKGDEP